MAANKLLYAHGENVSDTIPGSIGSGDTSITVNAISKWNSNGGAAIIDRGTSSQEIVIASGISGSSLTIATRGAYGTTAVGHNANATIESVPFAHDWNNVIDTLKNLFKAADGNIDITLLGSAMYVADSGTANTYAATLSPVAASYTAGMVVRFKAANTNTGASTLNVNALGAKNIYKLDGATALKGGEIQANGIYTCIYDGTQFQLQSAPILITNPRIDTRDQVAQTYSPSAAGTATLDLSLGDEHRITMPAGNITIALSNDTNAKKFIISITQDSGGSRTVTWFTTIKWSGGSAPTLTTTANKRDTFGFVRTGTGTYDGFIIGQNV